MNISQFIVERLILKRFLRIQLTKSEYEMAQQAIVHKYRPAIRDSALFSILLIPSLLTLDTQVVVSVLIPTTMVAGTAWFSVSLASLKKKFEEFGIELTRDLFVAFSLSLLMLFFTAAASLTRPLWHENLPSFLQGPTVQAAAAFLALVVVWRLLFSIFSGSLKYDINDAMLTGQNEAAERYFKQSLSLLHSTSSSLRNGLPLQVANYSIGVAFYEVLSDLQDLDIPSLESIDSLLEQANSLITEPSMGIEVANERALGLASFFVMACDSRPDVQNHKSLRALKDEISCLERNENEQQEMIDTRMSVVFSEMSNLIEAFGQSLFGSEDQDHES